MHGGNYGCSLSDYSFFLYYPGYIYQFVNYNVDNLQDTAISFYMKYEKNDIKLTVTYTDASTYITTFSKSSSWRYRYVPKSSLASGKMIYRIKFERIGTNTKACAIDDIEFHLENVPTNGDFETGSLNPWITSSTYSASVKSSSYYVYDGSYGCSLAEYDQSSSLYYAAYIEQDIIDIGVNGLFSNAITCMLRSYENDLRITVTYTDDTTSTFTFEETNGAWYARIIEKDDLPTGKRIDKIKFERIGNGYSTTAIDRIIVNAN